MFVLPARHDYCAPLPGLLMEKYALESRPIIRPDSIVCLVLAESAAAKITATIIEPISILMVYLANKA